MTTCWARPARRRRDWADCCAGPAPAPPPRCSAPPAAAWTWRSATPRCASSSASPSARSRPSAPSAPRCCWRRRTRTRRSTTRRGRSTRAPRTPRTPPRSPRLTRPTPLAGCAARPSRCTAASASPGSTTCTCTSSGPRPWGRSTATPSTTASWSSTPSPGKAAAVTSGLTPLDGIRVVDLTSYIAGSYGAMMLADLGASVVKVEALEGDSFRELPGFFGWNRGKRSIALNLKTPEGREIVERLAREGDVVMENWRPGVADRLGVGHERLMALNPRLIYLSVSAFGSTGPYADRPGFDPILQALGGVMTLQGFGGPPKYLRTAPTDYYTAALGAQAVLAALFTRERTGRGQRIETSLLGG